MVCHHQQQELGPELGQRETMRILSNRAKVSKHNSPEHFHQYSLMPRVFCTRAIADKYLVIV